MVLLPVLLMSMISAAASAAAFYAYYRSMLALRGIRPTTRGVAASCLGFVLAAPAFAFLGMLLKERATASSPPVYTWIPYAAILTSSVLSVAIWRDSRAPFAAASPVAGAVAGCILVRPADDFGFMLTLIVLTWHAFVFSALYFDARPRWRRAATIGGGPS